MSKWKKFAGLFVQVQPDGSGATPTGSNPDGDEIERILAETRASLGQPEAKAAPTPPPAAPPPAPAPAVWTEPTYSGQPSRPPNAEERPFPDIYAEARVPPSPFPAEKLLKVLDGLAALEPAVRIAAVTAMDAADDGWAIQDPVADARNKIQSLQDEQQRRATLLQGQEAETVELLAEQDRYLAEATTLINQEIAKLQEQLKQENQNVGQRKAEIQGSLVTAREFTSWENARLAAEIARLNKILVMFALNTTHPGA